MVANYHLNGDWYLQHFTLWLRRHPYAGCTIQMYDAVV